MRPIPSSRTLRSPSATLIPLSAAPPTRSFAVPVLHRSVFIVSLSFRSPGSSSTRFHAQTSSEAHAAASSRATPRPNDSTSCPQPPPHTIARLRGHSECLLAQYSQLLFARASLPKALSLRLLQSLPTRASIVQLRLRIRARVCPRASSSARMQDIIRRGKSKHD